MSFHGRMPNAVSNRAVASAPIAGHRKLRLILSTEVLRQASSGPIAVNSNNSRANGTFTRLKDGGPTVTLVPCTHSESTGKRVPQSPVKRAGKGRKEVD